MAAKTKIEWTEVSWNPITGCSKISRGCKNCYAERMAFRLQAMGQMRYRNGFQVTLQPDLLDQPDRWRTARIIFVNSMSDLFHDEIPLSYIKEVFKTIKRNPHHTFQILTKRAKRLSQLANELEWPHNLWMGVSVEDDSVTNRIDDLRLVPAKIRFLSCEPLIGPIQNMNLHGIDWVIVGGESGHGARPMNEDWVIDIQKQCADEQVSFFFKQWGGVRKKKNGRTLNGQIYDARPPTAARSVTKLVKSIW